jgi:hypothetical protein
MVSGRERERERERRERGRLATDVSSSPRRLIEDSLVSRGKIAGDSLTTEREGSIV